RFSAPPTAHCRFEDGHPWPAFAIYRLHHQSGGASGARKFGDEQRAWMRRVPSKSTRVRHTRKWIAAFAGTTTSKESAAPPRLPSLERALGAFATQFDQFRCAVELVHRAGVARNLDHEVGAVGGEAEAGEV